MNLPNHNVCSC